MLGALVSVAAAVLVGAGAGAGRVELSTPEALGEALFFDTGLSRNRTQSCATCHDPGLAFTDPRPTAVGRAVSLGDDGVSLGDRNTPTAAYAAFSPAFGPTAKPGVYRGGQFHDGRAATLEEQAKGPPLNPAEMAMPDEAAVVARLRENPAYETAFRSLYGASVFDTPGRAYDAMAASIAAYERTAALAPFDSRYDRFLRGEVTLTEEEELGRVLFFSPQFTNCSECHRLRAYGGAERETFTSYEFHNIGVPENPVLHRPGGQEGMADRGLSRHPAVDDPAQDGKFKVPTLRNVAVTGPYMHNGVFADLRTVVLFYNVYNLPPAVRPTNPETGRPFAAPEVPENLSLKELKVGPALDDRRVDALVAFLRTLTDRRYEPLLDD